MTTQTTRSKCECGRAKNKYARRCNRCQSALDTARYAEAQAIVATGICPDCGRKLRRNLSITGWWQCEQLGADTHRADPTKPSCSFQTFTC